MSWFKYHNHTKDRKLEMEKARENNTIHWLIDEMAHFSPIYGRSINVGSFLYIHWKKNYFFINIWGFIWKYQKKSPSLSILKNI